MNLPAALEAIGFGAIALLVMFVLDRWVTPWRTRRLAQRIIRNVGTGKPAKPRQYRHAIAFDELGFTVSSTMKKSDPVGKLAWSAVHRVMAFKRDYLTVDCICLVFAATEEQLLEIDEEMGGWDEFTQELPKHLPGSIPWAEWFMAVAFPAFATNATEIYSRKSPC